jgi:hypothetical protein
VSVPGPENNKEPLRLQERTHLRLDVKGGELLLSTTLTIVAWVNTDFNLSVEASVDF